MHSDRILDYWCTWATQGATASTAGRCQRDQIDLDLLVGSGGWLHDIDPELRPRLLVVLDDGWDVERGIDQARARRLLGGIGPDPERFPGIGDDPGQRLCSISRRIRELGFRGTGLWIAAQARDEDRDPPWSRERQEAYWTERLAWSRDAGIAYWKVDWGVHWNDLAFRRMLTHLARRIVPALAIEHAVVMRALNDWDSAAVEPAGGRGSGRFSEPHAGMLRDLIGVSDVIRTYDASLTHAVAVTFDRVACLLSAGADGPATHVNVEGHPYLAAGLGMCAGIMQHPRHWRSGRQPTWDAVRRFLLWRACTAPLPLGVSSHCSDELLTSASLDTRTVMDEGSPEEVDVPVRQLAPAAIARGMALPVVEALDPDGLPFVALTRHPEGHVALAALERHVVGRGQVTPPARITIDLGGNDGPLAVFGTVGELRVIGCAGRRLVARDLLAGEGVPLPSDAQRRDGSILLPGAWLAQVGTAAASPGDPSGPGLIITSAC
jgi:hypothetical protein